MEKMGTTLPEAGGGEPSKSAGERELEGVVATRYSFFFLIFLSRHVEKYLHTMKLKLTEHVTNPLG